MDRTKDVDRIQSEVDRAIANLDPVDALDFVEDLASRLVGVIEGLKDDIESADEEDEDYEGID